MTNEATSQLLLAVNRYMLKRGSEMGARTELVNRINEITGRGDPGATGKLDAIIANTTPNVNIHDISVIHLYNEDFSKWLLNPDNSDTCPYGYTVEVHERCFDKYTEEEFAAAMLHDILQVAMSDTAKVRFMRAYTTVTSKYNMDRMLDLFSSINLSEVLFMMFTEICLRPFRVPAEGYDYVATDEALKAMGLADAYDSYLGKCMPMSNDTPEDRIQADLANDVRDVNTIIKACLDHDIRHYYTVIRDGVPLITLRNILGGADAMAAVGFKSRKVNRLPARRGMSRPFEAVNESYNDPKNEFEIRWQIDKIINAMRYAESEAERNVVLFKIKQLSMKLAKARRDYSRGRHASDPRQIEKVKFLDERLDELERLRKQMMAAEIKTKRWSVYVKDQLPAGYDF